MRSRSACSLLVIACTTLSATAPFVFAQTPVPGSPLRLQPLRATSSVPAKVVAGETPSAEAQDPIAAAAAAAAAGQDPAAAAASTQRVAKWKTLQFDRRPSSILAAWSAPELKPYDPAEEKEKEAKEKAAKEKAGTAAAATEAPKEPTREEIERMLVEQFGQTPPAAPAGAAPNPATVEQQLAEKKLQRECEMLQRDVTLGRWHKVAEFLATMPEKERKGCYEHFLRVLPNHPPRPEDQRVPPNLQEKNRFAFEDVFALAALAPKPEGFDKKQIAVLAPFVQRAMEAGSVLEEFVRLLAVEVQKPAAELRLDRRMAALLLSAIGQDVEMGPFLPTLAEAEQGNDREALNLMARHALAMHQKEKKTSWLGTAWQVTQAALAKGEIGDLEKAEALRRAVELAPKVSDNLGPAWLGESFTQRPERGMEIIATIGGQVAKGFADKPADPAYRASGLRLQKTAVEALLKEAPQLAGQWKPTLALLASGWVVEASYSYTNSKSDTFGPVMERDEFGNIFWSNRRMGGGGQVQAIEPADLVEAQPGAEWAALLDDSLQPHFLTVSAQLFLKVNEPEKAFPFIERLGGKNPRKAKDLAHEFLRVWMRNHNPNANSRTNSYMFMYGFERRANGIPLTRSKQVRNLQELGNWVERLRQLPIGGVDEQLLAEAFTTAHSPAEVYRLDTIERVFGDVGKLDPVLLGELLGKMRTNLATIWRRPSVQEEEKTRRSQREMLEEVMKGYQTALTVAQRATQKRGDHWALLVVVGSLMHDMNNFAKELKRDAKFADARKTAFAVFADAAKHYAKVVGDLRLDQETLRPFDTWFYAALGASDLGAVDEDTVLARSQLPLIKQAIEALPKGARERHQTMFANQLFTRMSAVKPQIKFRYLEAGFAVCGDHPQAIEAKKVWDYYQDLIAELRLEAVVDGSAAVGTEPFGVRVDIVHSAEIERESGGFQKYATNQNNQPYAYNYGRPLENYRDKFQEAVNAALNEHFEVLSITFNGESMTSKPTEDAGWRRTPYAWMLLKARGPQVDRIPEIKLDFDFLDTSGFTILPVSSSPVVLDASAKPALRPFSNLHVTQLLDERKADEGKITLEIKASAVGLVPDLDTILDLPLTGLVIDKKDDQGASVNKFSEEHDGIESERVWLLALKPADGAARPEHFVFGKPRDAAFQAIYQRYADADLETVSAEVALRGLGAAGTPTWLWIVLGLGFTVFFGWMFGSRLQTATESGPRGLPLPQHLTPFSVLALLDEVARRASLDADARQQLAADKARIEQVHFGRTADPSLDLVAVATRWAARVA
ncbi:MAG: hypothetical protein JNK15_08995 [Planctomycetes bacterium]|nr:hypothetical protein [Planctomycetota bacterium]